GRGILCEEVFYGIVFSVLRSEDTPKETRWRPLGVKGQGLRPCVRTSNARLIRMSVVGFAVRTSVILQRRHASCVKLNRSLSGSGYMLRRICELRSVSGIRLPLVQLAAKWASH